MKGEKRLTVRIGEASREVALLLRKGGMTARVEGREYKMNIHRPVPGVYSLVSLDGGGESVEAFVTRDASEAGCFRVRLRGHELSCHVGRSGGATAVTERRVGGGRQTLKAVMPGRVVRLLVEPGAAVKRGQGVLVVEAMKMENEIAAPRDGVLSEFFVRAGDRVESGAPLGAVD